jgi:hypothetical protein
MLLSVAKLQLQSCNRKPRSEPASLHRPAELARLAAKKAKSHPGAEKSVRLAVAMLTKTTMQVGG